MGGTRWQSAHNLHIGPREYRELSSIEITTCTHRSAINFSNSQLIYYFHVFIYWTINSYILNVNTIDFYYFLDEPDSFLTQWIINNSRTAHT